MLTVGGGLGGAGRDLRGAGRGVDVAGAGPDGDRGGAEVGGGIIEPVVRLGEQAGARLACAATAGDHAPKMRDHARARREHLRPVMSLAPA